MHWSPIVLLYTALKYTCTALYYTALNLNWFAQHCISMHCTSSGLAVITAAIQLRQSFRKKYAFYYMLFSAKLQAVGYLPVMYNSIGPDIAHSFREPLKNPLNPWACSYLGGVRKLVLTPPYVFFCMLQTYAIFHIFFWYILPSTLSLSPLICQN